ncbi:MAG TPA: aspartate ammonia-lyase [Polyangiaceae bacterium]|nr:aspartate ammonia-lyase [Polyangiaceae bacterium]
MNPMLESLRRSELFSDLDDSLLERLLPACQETRFSAGEFLFQQGAMRTAVFVIASGHVEIIRAPDAGGERLAILDEGDSAGEAALLGSAPHTASARALDAVSAVRIDREAVRACLASDGAAALDVVGRVASVMSQRLQYASTSAVGREKSYGSGATRVEHDLLGDREVPADALYGIQTLRAVENFPISGVHLSHFPTLVRALAMVKQGAARANARLGLLPPPVAGAIDRACQELVDGKWHGHFVVDMVQGGAGTSTNMNANEVIANRALELLGKRRGDYAECHPNNHVNLAQSTNDVYPTALRIATMLSVRKLISALEKLRSALAAKGEEFSGVLKMGRTQLQDAVPMTLGQEFTAFAVTTAEDIARLRETARLFLEINMGGTAIGTGINADPRYPELVVDELRQLTGLDVTLAENLVEATPDTGAFVTFSGTLKRIAVKLSKMCNDLRLLSSGPRCGLSEINLPPRQPGSSIMPGKVNPVIPEVVNQVAFQVIGNDLTITLAAEAGQLQLNVMEPILAFNTFQSIDILTAAVLTLTSRCIVGITANAQRCRDMVEHSIGIVTAVVPALGYDKTSEVARIALDTGRPVRDIILEKGYLSEAELDSILSPEAMTRPRPLTP